MTLSWCTRGGRSAFSTRTSRTIPSALRRTLPSLSASQLPRYLPPHLFTLWGLTSMVIFPVRLSPSVPSSRSHDPRFRISPPHFPSQPLCSEYTAGTSSDASAPPKDKGKTRLSAMARKFLAARNDLTTATSPNHGSHSTISSTALMDEQRLTKVLRLDSPPVLRPASIIGYSIRM